MRYLMFVALLVGLAASSASQAANQGLAIPLDATFAPTETTQRICQEVRKSLTTQLKVALGASNILSRCQDGALVLQYDTDRDAAVFAAAGVENPHLHKRTESVLTEYPISYLFVREDGVAEWTTVTFTREQLITISKTTVFESVAECDREHHERMGVPSLPVGTLGASACFDWAGVPAVLWVGLCDSLRCLSDLREYWTYQTPPPGPAPAPVPAPAPAR